METEEKNKVEGGVLYLVATPIGNLSDLSDRARKVLSEVSFIAAEDTRNSLRLLRYCGITKPLVSYHEHNKREKGEEIAARLCAGESCALVTDAGTPAISDPGEDLVALCAERGIPVTSVPGACALITALTLSALSTRRFVFEGFLPVAGKERRERILALTSEPRTVILHEAPHKLKATLADFYSAFGDKRKIALCRELTKLNEEIMRTTVGEALSYYQTHDPRGEYVLVLEGASGVIGVSGAEEKGVSPEERVAYYTERGMSKNEAIKTAAKECGIARNVLYERIIKK